MWQKVVSRDRVFFLSVCQQNLRITINVENETIKSTTGNMKRMRKWFKEMENCSVDFSFSEFSLPQVKTCCQNKKHKKNPVQNCNVQHGLFSQCCVLFQCRWWVDCRCHDAERETSIMANRDELSFNWTIYIMNYSICDNGCCCREAYPSHLFLIHLPPSQSPLSFPLS